MFKRIFTFGLLAASSTAFAGQDFVAKVESQSCLTRRSLKVGSGTVFRSGADLFVLSSDHVLFHGDSAQGVCHRIVWNGEVAPAELRAAHVFKGLSLLELKGRVSESLRRAAVDLSALALQSPSELTGSFGTLVGVPGASVSPLRSAQSQILSAQGTRRPLPGVSFMIEAKGHSEYGMSGGALLDSRGQFTGVISHQFLKLRLGAHSSLHSYEEGAQPGEMIALVVPGVEALSWMKGALQGDPVADLRLEVAAQLKGQERLSLGGIRFSSLRCARAEGAVGGEGAGIGGALMHGGEGAGIGGAGADPICALELDLDRVSISGDRRFTDANWFRQAREKLLGGARIRIRGLFKDGVHVPLTGLVSFFAAVDRGAMPLMDVQSPFTPQGEVMGRISKQARAGIAAVESLEREVSASLLAPLEEIRLSLVALENGQFEALTPEKIDALILESFWDELLAVDFTVTVELKSSLLRIREELARVRI